MTAFERASNYGSLAPAPGMMGDPMFGARRARKRAPGERQFLFNVGSFGNGAPGRVVTFKTCNCLSKEPCNIDFAMSKKQQKSEPIRSAKNEPSRSIILVFAALPFVPKTRLKKLASHFYKNTSELLRF